MSYLLIILGIASRLLPHPPNFTPVTALALFAPAYIKNKYLAIIFPLAIMVVSDIFLGFHNVIAFVYGSFILVALLGLYLYKHKTLKNIILITLASSLLFFVITNFGVWLVTPWYQKTWSGLLLCYTLAIPFLRNSLLGDIFYVGMIFGSYELVVRLWSKNKRVAYRV